MATGGDTIVSGLLYKRKREEREEFTLDRSLTPSKLASSPTKKTINQSINQSAEVLALTYGALVRQLVADLDDVADVNARLDTM